MRCQTKVLIGITLPIHKQCAHKVNLVLPSQITYHVQQVIIIMFLGFRNSVIPIQFEVSSILYLLVLYWLLDY